MKKAIARFYYLLSHPLPIMIGLSIFTLILYGITGSFSRFVLDDYCSGFKAKELGLVGAIGYWYINWSGRFSANILDTLSGSIGTLFVAAAPTVAIIAWCAILFITLKRYFNKTAALAMAVVLPVITLATIPDIGQSLYWGQGMRSVIPPLTLLPLILTASPAVAFTAAFVAGGFSETFAAMQVVLIAISLVLPKRTARVWALEGALLSLGLVILAPGNAVRSMALLPHPDLISLALKTSISFAIFIAKNLLLEFYGLAFMGLFAFILWARYPLSFSPAIRRKLLLSIPLMMTILILGSLAPALWALSSEMPARTVIIPQFIFIVSSFIFSYVLFSGCKRMAVHQALITLVSAVIFIDFIIAPAAGAIKAYQDYSVAWEIRDRASGMYNLASPIAAQDMSLDWARECVAGYYKFR